MDIFSNIPVEIIVHILSSCDDCYQLFSLVSICKHWHSTWMPRSGSITWDIGMREVICFNDALMAVRATNIVKAAFQAGERPPDPFPIVELSGTYHKPSIQELNGTFALRHMMDCIKHNILHWEVERLTACNATEETIAAETAFMRSANSKVLWDTNVYRALYRNVLIGAVCSRAFMEPMVSAIETGNPVAAFLQNRVPQMERQHLEYLARSPAYSSDPAQYEQVFKPLAYWIVAEGRARNQDDKAIAGDMLHVLAAHEHLKDKILNDYDHKGRGKDIYLGRYDITHLHRPRPASGAPYPYNGKVTVVLFGIFQLEDIHLPLGVMVMTPGACLVASPHRVQASRIPFWPCLKYPMRNTDYTPPGPALHFFQLILEKYLGWRFTDKAFLAWDDDQEDPQEDLPYHSIPRLFMFCDGQWDDRLIEPIS